MEKYDIVLESVSAKQEQLNAKVQEFYSNISNSGLISGLLEVGKGFMDIMNFGGGLVGKLALLITGFTVLNSVITSAKLSGLRGIFIGIGSSIKTVVTAIPRAIAGLKAQKTAQDALNTATATGNALQKSNIWLAIAEVAIMAIWGIVEAVNAHNKSIQESIDKANELKETYAETSKTIQDNLSTLTSTTINDDGTLTTLSDEFKKLAQGVDAYGDNINLTNSEYQRYLEICDMLVGINPELAEGFETNAKAIANNKDAVDELIKSQRILANEKAKNNISASTVNDLAEGSKGEYDKAYEEASNKSAIVYDTEGGSAYVSDYVEEVLGIKRDKWDESVFDYIANNIDAIYANLDEIIDKASKGYTDKNGKKWSKLGDADIKYLKQYIEDVKAFVDNNKDSMRSTYLSAITASTEYLEGDLTNSGQKFITEWINNSKYFDYSGEDATEIQTRIKAVQNMVKLVVDNGNTEIQDQLNELFNFDSEGMSYSDYTSKISDMIEQIVNKINESLPEDKKLDLGEIKIALGFDFEAQEQDINQVAEQLSQRLGVSVEDIKKKIEALDYDQVQQLLDLDLSNIDNWDEFVTRINMLGEALVGMEDILDDFTNQMLSASDNWEILHDALAEFDESGAMSAETFQKIIDNDLLQYLDFAGDKLAIVEGCLYDTASGSTSLEQSLKATAIASLQAGLAEDIYKLATEGVSDAELEAKKNTDDTATAITTMGDKFAENSGKVLDMATAMAIYNSVTGDKTGLEGKEKQLQGLVNTYNNAIGAINKISIKTSSKSGSGSSSSSKKWWEKDLDNLKEQLENNTITMETYINGLEKLRSKLKKGSEAYNEVNKELQGAKLDNLNNQFDRSEITIDQYISKLIELRSEYAKTSEIYKELTKTINEAKADKFADQYERGIISLKEYIEELANLRDSYVKNSEEWYKYNDLINETQMDSYESQYERGEISADKYIAKLKAIQQTLEKDSELYKEIGDIIEDTLLEETEKWVEELQKSTDEIDNAISQLGEVNTVEEQVRYAELLSDKYEQVQSNISKIQEKLKDNTLTEEQRITLQEELNDLLEEEVDIRDEIEDQVRTYYENQKEQAEQQAELTKKQTLYNKEVELYGKQGKELFEYYTNKEIEALEAKKDALDENNEREQLENDILEARLKLQNALNSKTTKILKKQSDGTWQYEYSANMVEVKNAQEELANAEKALEEYDLQSQIDELNKNMQNLADQYADAEFWAEREYEQTMNAIDKAYGDIDSLVEKWMDEYGDSTTELVTSYQSLVSANNKLEQSLVNLESAIESKYETVGTNKVSTKDGVKSFDTGGKIVGTGLIFAHNKERVLTAQQNLYFEQLISKLPQLLKAVDVTKFGGYISSKTFGSRVSADKVNSTVIHNVNCNFPNINSTDGLQQAILQLPRLALQNK